MILNRLRASNVLKYARLELSNLPEKGQIAISGPNESGKTAVVETICFALFGRTFSQGPDELARVIRWGETDCEAELVFTGNNNKVYTIRRSVDASGVHAAELFELNSEHPFASGPRTVHDAVIQLCGFEFQQYLDALYLAQMEISAPHSQSDTIKEIAGTMELEHVVTLLEEEITAEEVAIQELDEEQSRLEHEIELTRVDSDMVERLEQQRASTEAEIREHEAELERLAAHTRTVQEAAADIEDLVGGVSEFSTQWSIRQWRDSSARLKEFGDRLRAVCTSLGEGDGACAGNGDLVHLDDPSRRIERFQAIEERLAARRWELSVRAGQQRTSSDAPMADRPLPRRIEAERRAHAGTRFSRAAGQLLFLALGMATLLTWFGWWVTRSPKGSGPGLVSAWLRDHAAWWEVGYGDWLLPSAIGLTVLTLLILGWPLRADAASRRSRAQLDQLQAELASVRTEMELVDRLVDTPVPEVDAYLGAVAFEDVGKSWSELVAGDGAILVDDRALDDYREDVTGILRSVGADVVKLSERVAVRAGALRQAIEDKQDLLDGYSSQFDVVRQRSARAGEFQDSVDQLAPAREGHEGQIRLRKLAARLARETCRHIYRRFNGVLSKYTSEVMPTLTENRYSQLQIDDDLTVRVFSAAKNDFGELSEFSSGTQRQMMLAVRLAMAKALIEAIAQRRQFIILDEPFAFFDRERIRSTLRSLPNVDKRMTQIWIISQEFESYTPFELHIACVRDSDELVVS